MPVGWPPGRGYRIAVVPPLKSPMPRKVLDVGQCDLDNYLITQMLQRQFGAEVTRVRTHRDAQAALEATAYDLVLINRINDADGSPGLEFLRSLKADPATAAVPVMLVSNYADAQADAVAAGAQPGFGKSQLDAAETRLRLAACLEN